MKAMVASGNALASMTGLRVMLAGGNAVDATIATNAVLHVTSPFVCGMGGDLFALVFEASSGKVYGFNGSGRSAAAISAEYVRGLGHERMPRRGGLTVTVPGCVDAWSQLHERFGTRPWPDLLQPAIEYAHDGHPVGPDAARSFAAGLRTYADYPSWLRTFAPGGGTPAAGSILRQPELAASLERVASEGRDGLYRGDLARRIVEEVQAGGGVLTEEDLAQHRGEWADPVATTYRGNTVYSTAPNSQGITLLIALNLLDEVDLRQSGAGSPQTLAYIIEAAKLAYADRDRYVTDPAFAQIPTGWLLSKDRLRGALALGKQVAPPSLSTAGDTMTFSVVDQAGNAVCCIQSNYGGFGSGLAVGGFGLQNRGAYFSLEEGHVNRLEPLKRTMHTLIATMVMAADRPWILLSSVGGDVQPQTQLQVLTNVIDYGMTIQDAIEAPRFVMGGQTTEDHSLDPLRLETRFDTSMIEELRRMGYEPVEPSSLPGRPGWSGGFGYAQAIEIDPSTGVRFGGADPRWDAYAIGF
jgi:gamma-glutamyltranspeptidase/glutathione hydrolase